MKSFSKQKQERFSYHNSGSPKCSIPNCYSQERRPDLCLLRSSFSSAAHRNFCPDIRHSNTHCITKKQMQTLKQTIDRLEDKVNAAKEQLQLPIGLNKCPTKAFVHYDEATDELQEGKEEQTITAADSEITLKNNPDKKLAALINSTPKPKNFKPAYSNPYSPRRNAIYYISEAIRAVNEKNSLVVEHISGSIRIIKECENYEIPSLAEMASKKLQLKRSELFRKKKTLVLDLDETLVHCVDNCEEEADLRLKIKLEGEDEREHHFGINIRPYALTFLKKMACKFQIVVFTASQQEYADAILDELDPDQEIFQHRLYRHHCWVLQNQMHVKDIRIINRNLSEMVLVDNAAYSYCFQLENGIPILPYYEGSDYELGALETYLAEIEKAADVRELNKQTFKLHHYTKFRNGQELIQQLYINSTI